MSAMLQTLSGEFERALAANATGAGFTTQSSRASVPGSVTGEVGHFKFVYSNAASPAVEIWPLAGLFPGEQFSLRLYAWNPFGDQEHPLTVWVPELLAEFLCTVGDLPGPTPKDGTAFSPYTVAPTERFCDGLSLTAGTLGDGVGNPGFVNAPGPGFVATARLTLKAPRRLSFDFDTPGANAYWRRA